MIKKYFILPLAALIGCASQNLPKSYVLNPEMGILYSRINSIHSGVYLTLKFENSLSKEIKEHTVNRSSMDSRDTFIVTELKPGNWVFKTITLSTFVPGQAEYYPIKDTFDIALEIKKGKANYFPEIRFQEDCDFPLVSMAKMVNENACKNYEIEFFHVKKELDSVLVERYPMISPDESDWGAILERNSIGYSKKGGFGKTIAIFSADNSNDALSKTMESLRFK